MDIDQSFFLRGDIVRFGIAPLTSMYWFSETRQADGVDWRPEVHDSDGLAMWTGLGRAAVAPAQQSAAYHGLGLWRHLAEGLRPAAARPRVRPLSRRRESTSAAPACGSSPRAIGARARSIWSSFRPTTRSTTISSPCGCPTSRPSPARSSTSPIACTGRPTSPIPAPLARVRRDAARQWRPARPAAPQGRAQVPDRIPGRPAERPALRGQAGTRSSRPRAEASPTTA